MVIILKNSIITTSHGLAILKENIDVNFVSGNNHNSYDFRMMMGYKGPKPIATRDAIYCTCILSTHGQQYYDTSEAIIKSFISVQDDVTILDTREWLFPKDLCQYSLGNKAIIILTLLAQHLPLIRMDKILVRDYAERDILIDESELLRRSTIINREKNVVAIFLKEYVPKNIEGPMDDYQLYDMYMQWCMNNYGEDIILPYSRFFEHVK